MDAKYLEEIKARTEEAAEEGIGLQQLDDLERMIDEVERLTEENDVLKSECRAHIQKQGNLFKGYQQMKTDNAAKDQQIATLKKALKKASVDAADEQCPHEFDLYTCDKCADCPHYGEIHTDAERDAQCWYDYFIHQAQKQEAEK